MTPLAEVRIQRSWPPTDRGSGCAHVTTSQCVLIGEIGMTDDNDVIARLEAKIETVIRLLALQLLTKGQTLREQSLLLHRAGLSTLENRASL